MEPVNQSLFDIAERFRSMLENKNRKYHERKHAVLSGAETVDELIAQLGSLEISLENNTCVTTFTSKDGDTLFKKRTIVLRSITETVAGKEVTSLSQLIKNVIQSSKEKSADQKLEIFKELEKYLYTLFSSLSYELNIALQTFLIFHENATGARLDFQEHMERQDFDNSTKTMPSSHQSALSFENGTYQVKPITGSVFREGIVLPERLHSTYVRQPQVIYFPANDNSEIAATSVKPNLMILGSLSSSRDDSLQPNNLLAHHLYHNFSKYRDLLQKSSEMLEHSEENSFTPDVSFLSEQYTDYFESANMSTSQILNYLNQALSLLYYKYKKRDAGMPAPDLIPSSILQGIDIEDGSFKGISEVYFLKNLPAIITDLKFNFIPLLQRAYLHDYWIDESHDTTDLKSLKQQFLSIFLSKLDNFGYLKNWNRIKRRKVNLMM